MKKYLLGAAAILTIAAPATAYAEANGYVGATYSQAEVDDGVTSDDTDIVGIEGALAFGGNGGLGFELDAATASADDGDDNDAWGATAHLFGRSDSHLFGGFVGFNDGDGSETLSAGLEAEKYFTNWTLAGALAYATNDDVDADGYGVNGEARFFLNDNLRLEAGLGWANVDVGGTDDDALSYNLGAEWQLSSTPISLLAGWSHSEFDESDIDVDALTVGIRWNFGGTLKDRDRTGASLAGLSGLGGAISGL